MSNMWSHREKRQRLNEARDTVKSRPFYSGKSRRFRSDRCSPTDVT